jgi:S-adenosylmethionine:tRNA ribosyltransferase-isomerase
MEYLVSDFDFSLPADRIAQEPCLPRDQARLLVLDRKTGERQHRSFRDILDYLDPGDVLVVNNTRVVPVLLAGKKATGGRVECLILHYPEETAIGTYTSPCLLTSRGKIRPGDRLEFGQGVEAEVLPPAPNGTACLRFFFEGPFEGVLKERGRVPLPPYIERREPDVRQEAKDRQSYQTVYAAIPGAVAAPTAGLHFTRELLGEARAKGIQIAPITLHVGYGTFAPIKTERISEHTIHTEPFEVTDKTASLIRDQKRQGRRIIAVGSTSVRVLEYLAFKYGEVREEKGQCDLYIRPGFRFRLVDGMITNFHFPKTTLMVLVSAFAGRETILRTYQEAIRMGYRFYSYGDAMLIL